MVKKFELYGLTSNGDVKTFLFSLAASAISSTCTSSAGAGAPYEPPEKNFTNIYFYYVTNVPV